VGAAQPAGGWPARVAAVVAMLDRLAGMPLSMFGRAFGSASYALSKLLYHAEFCGQPPRACLAQLTALAARLVDRGLPSGPLARRAFTGVRADLLVGHPSGGGFGALPLVEHIRARHAVWGARLLSGEWSAAWVPVARALLAAGWEGAWQPMAGLVGSEVARVPGGLREPPEPLRRMLGGLRALPPVRDVAREPLELGAWCAAAPLWGNPFLPSPSSAVLAGLEESVAGGFFYAGLRSVGDALRLQPALAAAARGHRAYQDGVWHPLLQGSYHFPNRERLQDLLPALLAAVPAGWAAAPGVTACVADGSFAGAGLQAEAVGLLLPRLGWLAPGGGACTLRSLTVRVATSLQLEAVQQERARRHQLVELAARAAAPPAAAPAAGALPRALQALWRVRWDNRRKEAYWRLLLDALPTPARLHVADAARACPCGGAGAAEGDRQHHFWHCAAAQAVAAQLRGAAAPAQLHMHHVWLVVAPPGVNARVWPVVCLAAVDAMRRGMQLLTVPAVRRALAAAGRDPVEHASRAAVSHFWGLLEEFARVGGVPQAWRRFLPPGHPFLHYPTPAARLSVNCWDGGG
jgi:hypothetical protein